MEMHTSTTRVSIGTVVATPDSPSTQIIRLTLRDDLTKVERGELVEVDAEGVPVLALVFEIQRMNAYYSSADMVGLGNSTHSLASIFPTEEWNTTLVSTRPLGQLTPRGVKRMDYPVSPGDTVHRARPEAVRAFLGLRAEGEGLHLGMLARNSVPVVVDLNRLLRKHLAILAISGAGKSYAASVLLEELLGLPAEAGRIGLVVIDSHGEYSEFSKIEEYASQVEVVSGRFVSIGLHGLKTGWQFRELAPDMSSVQVRYLDGVLRSLRSNKSLFDMKEVISEVEKSSAPSATKEAIVGRLYELEQTKLFGVSDNPSPETVLAPGKLVVFDLADIDSLRSKQMIVAYFARRFFELRRRGCIPPLLFVVEEAHSFASEMGGISKSIIEKIAREGRKFYFSLCLISQRPAYLSTTALSQCNSHLIMRIRNPNDLDFIQRTSEGIDKAALAMLPDLDPGEGLLSGEGVNRPVFFTVRSRNHPPMQFSASFQEAARDFDESARSLKG